MTGGVTRNVGMVRALEEVLGRPLQISPDAHFMGAVGAAIFALEKLDQSFESECLEGPHAVSGRN
jgi:activator of 2-hydroxyglutaryl-CoA dehydratase